MRSKYTFLLLLFAFAVYTSPSQAQIITTFAGDGEGASTGTGSYTGDGGLANQAGLNSCTAVTFDGAGNVYIADRDNNVVRKVDFNGVISTFAGTGTAGYNGDHFTANVAELNKPYAVAVDAAGNVYIADYGNHVVRMVSTAGIITTIAGTGTAGYSGNGGAATAATLHNPQGIAVDQYANIYVSEAGNNVVRKITASSGMISTVAGNGTIGYSGNGGNATGAQLDGPAGIAVDAFGDIYVADYYNNVVRMVDTNGIINNFAGTSAVGNTGDGGAAASATLHTPSGVSVFGHGNVYISDQGNNVVRVVDQSGIITRFAGSATNGYTGDGGQATAAQLSSPKGLAVDGLGKVYIADYDNNVIRLVSYPEAVQSVAKGAEELKVYPNPNNGSFNISLPAAWTLATITITDVTGNEVTKIANTKLHELSINLGYLPSGSYFISAVSGGKTYSQKIVLR